MSTDVQFQLHLVGIDESQIPPGLVKLLSDFITMLRRLFSSLKPDVSEAEMDLPEVQELSQEIQKLAQRLAQIMQELIKDCQVSLTEMDSLMSCDPSTFEGNERIAAYRSKLQEITRAADARCKKGVDKMDEWQDDVAKFRVSSTSKFKSIDKKIEGSKKAQRRIRDKQVANGKFEFPQVKGLACTLLRACIVPLVGIASDRIAEKLDEKLGFVREDISHYRAGKDVLKNMLSQANGNIDNTAEGATLWWQGAGLSALEIRDPLPDIETAPIAPQTAKDLKIKILIFVNILTQFDTEVSRVLREASMIEPSLTNAVEDFETAIRSLAPVLTRLTTVEDILSRKSSQDGKFPARIEELTKLLTTRLKIVRDVFRSWSSHLQHRQPTDPMTFVAEISIMLREVPSLSWAAQPVYDNLYGVMENDISSGKSKRFEDERKKEDRDGQSEEQGRRLANQTEALQQMSKLHEAMKNISVFSAELSLSLLHFNGSGAHTTPRGGDMDAVKHLPRNPFDVPSDVVQRVSGALQVEISSLQALAFRPSSN